MIPVSARNIEFVGHTPQNGRGDGVQVMVHKGHAFVGHMFSDGFTITDVSDPRQPCPVNFVAAPPNSRALHLQTHDNLLLTVNAPSIWVLQGYSDPNDYFKASITETFTKREKTFTAGLRVYDIAKPAEPREIGFMPVDGLGLHRLWYVGGRYAYASCHWQGFTDHVLAVIDLAEPTRPEVIGRWWLPGMHTAGGETPSWSGRRYALHHAIVSGNLAYAAWRDGGMTILDVADPTAPKLLAHRNWCPPFGGGTHTPLPLPAAISRSSPMRAISTIAPTAFSAAGCSMYASRPTLSRSPRCRPRPKKTIAKKGRNLARTTCTRTAQARSRASNLSSQLTRMPVCGCSTSSTRSRRARSRILCRPPRKRSSTRAPTARASSNRTTSTWRRTG